ncbi:MAG: VOC family protein [Parasphingopyxis sp.]|uniref:VOC family protein n=1 Tax=Parasphingopyxis sp. TaxID=1920299 RepID=UPI003F9FBD47
MAARNRIAAVTATMFAIGLGASTPSMAQTDEGAAMERVLGIGGFFFRAQDPAALALWYRDNLGVDLTPQTYEVEPWQQEAGPTVFGPFSATTEYFGRPEQMWMINFRVADLDAMAAQLRANDIAVEIDPETYPNGRFARLSDPEGNPIQLWEPATPE